MSITKKQAAKSSQPLEANRILQIVTDANTPSNHRHNLSEMVIGWMKNDPDQSEEHRQDVYLTYVVLNSMLKEMEGGGE